MSGPLPGSGLHAPYYGMAFGRSYFTHINLNHGYLSWIPFLKDLFVDPLRGDIPKPLQQILDLLFIRIQFARVNPGGFQGLHSLTAPPLILCQDP
jgi:hypothetical protein